MKKIISLILALSILLSVCFIAQVNAEEIYPKNWKTFGDFKYIIKKNGKVKIKKYVGNAKTVKIPSEIEGKEVYSIGDESFMKGELLEGKKNTTLEKVVIPDTIYKIQDHAFCDCVNLKTVILGKNIEIMRVCVFSGCKKLKELKIPPKVHEFDFSIIYRTGIKSIHLGKNIALAHSYCFNEYNTNLEKITVSKKNKYYSSKDGILYNKKKTKLRLCPVSLKKKSLKLPSSVKIINDEAFWANKNLKKIILPNKLDTIRPAAFSHCKNLREITIPKNISITYFNAFSDCKKLTNFKILSKKAKIEERIFEGCGFKKINVTHKIVEGFQACEKLRKITILPDVKSIAKRQFFDCPKLKTVTIPKTVKKIGHHAFGFRYKKIGFGGDLLKVKGFTIKGQKNSAAQKYAKKYGFKFVKIK